MTAIAGTFACTHATAERALTALLQERQDRGEHIQRPDRFVKSILDSNPDRIRRLVLANSASSATESRLPLECGECEARPGDSPSARWRDDENGDRVKCWICHPAAFAKEKAKEEVMPNAS